MNARFLLGGALAVASALSSATASDAAIARSFVRPVGTFVSPAARGIAADVGRIHADVRDLGPLGSSKPVRIGLLLKYRHEDQLEALTIAQGDRRSPYYHRYLTVPQWDAYFAPDEQTYNGVIAKLIRSGFRIEQTFANRGMIRAVAPASTVARLFHTQFHSALQAGRGLRYYNVTPASMPEEFQGAVVGVLGLHSVVNMHFPIRFASRDRLKRRLPRVAGTRQLAQTPIARADVTPTPTPKPITTSTPGPNPSPDATESPGLPLEEFALNLDLGYGPPTFADAYDFPVQHGYGGRGHAAGSVIDSDFSDHDAALEYSTFNIPHTGKAFRVCTDPNDICTICKDTATTVSADTASCDPEGESTLDAQTIQSLAPAADFYEYLTNETDSLDDLDVDAAYERVVSDDVVETLNSSFGECETDDPAALYGENYIAMEGAAEGITFSASAGDTGGTSCGLYAGNGTPQTQINVSEPASAPYFTAVGGTSFQMLVTCTGVGSKCYTTELGWMDGGGGTSVFEPQPSWQTAYVAAGTTTPLPKVKGLGIVPASSGRDVPDLAFTADPETGVAIAVTYQGTAEGIGGTSLSSPIWVAMQTEINQVQNSRNGFVNPRLYAIAGASTAEDSFAFRDILLGDNVPFPAGPGYDLVTGIGSVLGWELAGTE